MPSDTLVYTTAFGPLYFYGLAERMVASLRKRGYAGDVVVLTDRMHDFPEPLAVRVLPLPSRAEPRLVKASLPAEVAGAYARILFADSDVVFLRHPGPLFDQARERMAVSVHPVPLLHYAYNLIAFPRAERKDPRTDGHAINTGLIAFPGGRYSEYAERWRAAWERFDRSEFEGAKGGTQSYMERDQPVLQALLWRGELDYAPLPDELTTMPVTRNHTAPLTPETVALHFCGLGRSPECKEEIIRLMEAFTGLDAFADFKALFDRLRELHHPEELPPASAKTPAYPLLPIEMTSAETALLDARLAQASAYLEYGVGASTGRALAFPNILRVDAVESGAEFLRAFLVMHPGVQAQAQTGRLVLHLVDIGPTGPMGYPTDASRKADWPGYAALPGTLNRGWDLVLVDGRFRVACILRALLLPGEPSILVHDFWSRPHYHEVLAHAEVVESADTMVRLRRRPDLDAAALLDLLSRYAYVPE